MIAPATTDDEPAGGSRLPVRPALELAVLCAGIAIGIASYLAAIKAGTPQRLIAPPFIALLLIVNIVPGVLLMMLLGRRVARRRAAHSEMGGQGRLHVRLVALFSITAAVPMLLVTVVASLLFQYGVQFWYSDQTRGVLENAAALARENYDRTVGRWRENVTLAASNLSETLNTVPIDDPRMPQYFGQQIFFRGLSDGVLFKYSQNGGFQSFLVLNPDLIDISREITRKQLIDLEHGAPAIVTVGESRISAVAPLPKFKGTYLYTATTVNVGAVKSQLDRGQSIETSYKRLLLRGRAVQLKFNIALVLLSLLIVGIAVWIALQVADRLVAPVSELVGAARRVESGDLTARVPDSRARDEVGTLSRAFNQMTVRMQEQNTALDNRRALIEAVMAGVSAGVIAITADRTISIVNSSAARLLGIDMPVGQPLGDVAPELDLLVRENTREAIIQVQSVGESRTLAVRITRADSGPILTFDDITQQLLDQRRAAWSDVARRIAHEIKNPLTPIQLAAERLQRRYGKTIDAEDGTFSRLTDTIIRQVGDLRRMVDEFSSFARMPKPVFQAESLVDIARQTLFLHEVAHADIRFSLVHDMPGPTLVCDRRQMGQALTNIVKNAVEAIGASGNADGEVTMTLQEAPSRIVMTVADNGVGLPVERDRIVEPYMTTRARGTGLGLAIVKKIIEEHFGTMVFSDRPGGGTLVTMSLDTTILAALDEGATPGGSSVETGSQLPALTRNRN